MAEDALLDRIYEAAVMPDHWPDVLDAVARLGGATGTALFVTDHLQISRWTTSRSLADIMDQWVLGGWGTRSQRMSRMVALCHPGFVTEHDLYEPAELEADPSYSEFLWPRGMGWGAGTFLPLPSGGGAVFSVERDLASGPMSRAEVDTLDAVRPHLARAALMAARIGLERAQSAMAVLDRLGLPGALLRADGSVLLTNKQFDRSGEHVVARAHGKVALRSSAAHRTFLAAIGDPDERRTGRSIPLPSLGDAEPAVLHIIPLRRSALDIFSGGSILMILTVLRIEPLPHASPLEGLFDLTPAEARLAGALCAGGTIESAADDFDVSRETVKTQLKRVFAKTGVSRQAELVNLLCGLRKIPEAPEADP